MTLSLLSWPGHPRSYNIFVVLSTAMGLEQAFEALGLYLPRYIDEIHDDSYHFQGFTSGLLKLAECHKVTQSMDDWLEDSLWMSFYFSLAVWTSIWLSIATLPQ